MPPTLPPNVQFDAKDQILRARFRGPFTGLDTTSSITNMDLMALRVADNCNIEEDGTISKRAGFISKLTSAWTSTLIRNGYEYVASYDTGTPIVFLYGEEAGANTGKIGTLAANFASVTSVTTGLPNVRPTFFQFDDRFFYYNGTAAKVIYGGAAWSSFRQIGITAPSAAPSLNTTINGSLTAGLVYTYAYTYYNSDTGAESSPSALFTSAAASADPLDGFRLNVTAGDSTTADTIRLYRTTANGSVLFLDTTAAISATTIDSTQADAGLGKQLELDNSRHTVFGEPRYAWVAENRVYATGMSDNPNRTIVSAIYSAGPMPETFPTKNFADCQSSQGNTDHNLGGGIAGDTVIMLKRNSIGRIEKIGADTTTASDDPVLFVYREISRAVTGISHFAACNVLGEYIWLGRDNIYATDGTNVRAIADKIQNDIKGFQLSPDDEFSAFNDLEEKRIYISIKSAPAKLEPDYVLVGHYSAFPEFYWTVYKAGDDSATYPGISAGCFFEISQYVNDTRRILFGNTTYSGKLFELANGTNDDGSPIAFRVRFSPVSFGMEEEEKLFIEDQVRSQGNGAVYTLSASSFYNYLLTEEDQQELSYTSSGSIWGSFLWGAGLWGANTPSKLRHFSHKKAYAKQLQLQQFGEDEPVIIYAFEMLARPTAWRA